MVPKKQFFLMFIIVMIALLGFIPQAHAEQVNNSVKDCLEQPDTCGEQQDSTQNETNTGKSSDISTNPKGTNTDQNTVGLTIWDFVKMIVATVFVVALLYFVLKFVNKKSHMFKTSHLMENLGGVPLGSNRSLQVIKVGNHLLIIGVGENIQLLKEIGEGQEYEQILSEYNKKLDQLVKPNDLIANVMRKVNEYKSNDRGKPNPPFQTLLKQQLDDLRKGRKKIYEEVEKSEGTDKK
jgi:flagellar protein FliO/FliZ